MLISIIIILSIKLAYNESIFWKDVDKINKGIRTKKYFINSKQK